MKNDILRYGKMLADDRISVIYSGPVWSIGIDGMAEMLQRCLDLDDLPLNISQSVFSVFVEQMNNMLMYSSEKGSYCPSGAAPREMAKGIFILIIRDNTYIVQSGNVVTESNVKILKERIDHLNTLDKKELRRYYKDLIKSENMNPESRGAGLGLVEIARRATSKIAYEFAPYGDGLSYFTMSVVI